MPDDGNRYELIGGEIVVSPSPVPRHQVIVSRLFRVLLMSVPEHLEVIGAPLDTVLEVDSVVQPDLLVCRLSGFSARALEEAPLLAVEVLSPSTARRDLTVKRDLYERAGVAAYWVVDPEGPALNVWERGVEGYGEPVLVGPDETWPGRTPFAAAVTPSDLVRGL